MKKHILTINGVLLLLVVGMTVAVLRAFQQPVAPPERNFTPDEPEQVAQLISGTDHALRYGRDRYETVKQNDLFRPEREPYVPPKKDNTGPTPTPTPKGTPVPPPQGLRLTATFYLGRERFALISERNTEKGVPQRYRVGDPLLDFTVAKITPDLVTLEKAGGGDENTIELPLRDFQNLPQAPPPQQAAAERPAGRDRRPVPPPIPKAEVEQREQVNPFEALTKALERAKRDREEQGYDTPDIEPPPSLPDFLKQLGAGDDEEEDDFDDE